MRQLRHEEVTSRAQAPTTTKYQSQDLNPGPDYKVWALDQGKEGPLTGWRGDGVWEGEGSMGWKPRVQGRADPQQGPGSQALRLETASCVPFPLDVMSQFPHL